MKVRDIINLTIKLKKECNNDINKLLDKYNCELLYANFENIFGYNNKIGNINYVFINKNLKKYEKKLVILHELGHIILHDSKIRRVLKKYINEKIEFQANLFATLFLEHEIKYCFKNEYFKQIINNVLFSLFAYSFYENKEKIKLWKVKFLYNF